MSDQYWTQQVEWMRQNGVVKAEWSEGGLLTVCELGPKPTTPQVQEPKAARVEPSALSILRQGSRLRLRTAPVKAPESPPDGTGT